MSLPIANRAARWQQTARLAVLLSGLSLSGCGNSSEPGVRVEVSSHALNSTTELLTEQGFELRLSFGAFTTHSVELLPCETFAARAWSWLVPEAHAHGVSLPTKLAIPTVQDLQQAARTLGVLAPPAERYCGVRVGFGPADADAEGLDQLGGMLGHSARVEGEYRRPGAEWQPFVLESATARVVSLPLDLELNAERRSARLQVRHDVTRWFDGLDFEHDDTAVRSARWFQHWVDHTQIELAAP